MSLVVPSCWGRGDGRDGTGEGPRRTHDLNLHIHLDQLLRQRIDLHQPRVHRAVEPAELRDQPHIPLADGPIWVRAADAAGHGAKASHQRSEGVDCAKKTRLSASHDVCRWYSHGWRMVGMGEINILMDPYQPWVAASSLSPWRVCA